MRERTGVEIKVGLLALIGMTILAVLVFSIGDYSLFQRRKQVNFIFSFAGGVETSAPVRMAGVKIGEVEEIELIKDELEQKTVVRVGVLIRSDITLYEDAKIYINSLGLLGEKYIEITDPGSIGEVEEGGMVRGRDPVPIEKITESTHRLVAELQELIGDDQVRGALKNSIYNFEQTTENLKNATGKVSKGEGTIGQLIYNDSFYNELDAFARDIRRRPWRLLKRDKETKERVPDKLKSETPTEDANRGFIQ